MRATGIAAIVSGLIAAAPIPASADQTITESFSLTVEPLVVPYEVPPTGHLADVASTPFPLFNPSDGTLDDVTVMLNGSIKAASLAENPLGDWFLVDLQNATLGGADAVSLSGIVPITVSDHEPFGDPDFEGSGNGEVIFQIGTIDPQNSTVVESVDPLTGSAAPLTGSITYTYALPAKTPAVPEPSTWTMMLLGFAGLGFAGYRRAKAGDATLARALPSA